MRPTMVQTVIPQPDTPAEKGRPGATGGRGTLPALTTPGFHTDPGGPPAMKLITAIIKPFKLDEVRQAIADIGLQGVTVTEVLGFGRQRGRTEFYRGAEYRSDLLPKTKVEIAVEDTVVDPVVEAISNVARTGRTGDGKICVTNLRQAVRIRTGERGAEAV
jgi:nitrogen regulatory protein P-II 2